MPWHTNTSLQLRDMYDQVYAHLIGTLKRRATILQILGQVIIAASMPPEVDIFGSPANSSSPKRLALILGLERGGLARAIADIHLMVELGDEEQDILIRHSSFLGFLLDRSRSQELFVDVDGARLMLLKAHIRYLLNIKNIKGT